MEASASLQSPPPHDVALCPSPSASHGSGRIEPPPPLETGSLLPLEARSVREQPSSISARNNPRERRARFISRQPTLVPAPLPSKWKAGCRTLGDEALDLGARGFEYQHRPGDRICPAGQ